LPDDVPDGLAPAVPLGVGESELTAPPTTVTAVTVLLLPSGKVVVCKTVEVLEVAAPAAFLVVELDWVVEDFFFVLVL